jgi:hypothetical protein
MYTLNPALAGGVMAGLPPLCSYMDWATPVPPSWGMGVLYVFSTLYVGMAVGGCSSYGDSMMMRICMTVVLLGTAPGAWFWWANDSTLLAGLCGIEALVALVLIAAAGRLFPASA